MIVVLAEVKKNSDDLGDSVVTLNDVWDETAKVFPDVEKATNAEIAEVNAIRDDVTAFQKEDKRPDDIKEDDYKPIIDNLDDTERQLNDLMGDANNFNMDDWPSFNSSSTTDGVRKALLYTTFAPCVHVSTTFH